MLDPVTRHRIATISGRAGGLSNVARNGGRNLAMRGNAGLLRRLENEVDPNGILTPQERAIRGKWALRAHMTTLALRRVHLRAKQTNKAEQAE